MKKAKDIHKLLKNVDLTINADADNEVLDKVLGASRKSTASAAHRGNIRRILTEAGIWRLAAAAVIIVAALLVVNHFGGSIDGVNVAWAEVVRQIEKVGYVHFYDIETKKNGHSTIREGWYAHGKIRTRQYDAEQTIDNGDIWMIMDEHNNVIDKGKSTLAEYDNVFDALMKDLLTFRFSEFSDKSAISIGSDFLIYEFDPSGEKAEWIDKITIMVGRNSLMPVQIKTYFKYEKWSTNRLLVFDYEAQEKPDAFFALPIQAKPPHGIGRVVLGGEKVAIELQNAPGIKKAIVRLHTKSEDSAERLLKSYRQKYKGVGEPTAFTEITFVTDEDYRSDTLKDFPLWLDQGVKAALGIDKTWPDSNYRYIIYTPVLRATDKENVFKLELSCWLKTKQLDL
ncbi:MAG TPA: hypothetical protein VMW72_23175 [Sedimentisphaerales bacterium]|nr:hypothetical protein [Sedimentisphaerales bacterium]